MTPESIMTKAEELRKEKVGLSNYQRMVNDILVMIRELARMQKEAGNG